MSIRIPLINGVRPTPKTTQTIDQLRAKLERLREEWVEHQHTSAVMWEKWADPKWKDPERNKPREYTQLPNGQIVRS